MLSKLRDQIIQFISSEKQFPLIAAIASGLYPLLYYYNSNFTFVNSWSQFLFFIICFLLAPCLVFFASNKLFKNVKGLKRYSKFIIPILNFTLFTYLLIISIFQFKIITTILVLLFAIVLGRIFYKHLNKVIVVQFLLASIVSLQLIPDFYKHFTYSKEWITQPDDIEDAVFIKKPNIYVIQPDGYANFSELKKGHYNFNNSEFEDFLLNNDFKLYQDYRSNYVSTLSSNSSMFAMKHHYYNNIKSNVSELYNTRQLIVGDNPVISILKRNKYKTFLILERTYLLVNRPEILYDYCNINYSEVPFLSRGFEYNETIFEDLSHSIENNSSTNNFYFIRKILPSHVSVNKNESKGIDEEAAKYLSDLRKTNLSLKKIISLINEKDKNSLIVIVADHGGYVGLSYSLESRIKQTDRDIIYSIFTSALAIKWPDQAPNFDNNLKTNVNLFRVLFSYLSEDESYLDYLQDDKSFSIIEKGAAFGIYEYIDENGNIVFNKK